MTELSPVAQAPLDALLNTPVNSRQVCDGQSPQIKLAAAIEKLADQVASMRPHGGRAWTTEQAVAYDALTKVADHHLAIAAELRGITTP